MKLHAIFKQLEIESNADQKFLKT